MWVDTRAEWRLAVVWITFMEHFFWVSSANYLAFVDSESVFGLSQDSPVYTHLIAKMDAAVWKGLWVGWHYDYDVVTIWPPRNLSAPVVRKVFLTSRMRNMLSFISYLGRAALFFLLFLEYLSTGRNFSFSARGPSTSRSGGPKFQWEELRK